MRAIIGGKESRPTQFIVRRVSIRAIFVYRPPLAELLKKTEYK